MPYKNDDFQDLFWKAGSDYPLRTDSSDWDNVAAKLNASANEPKANSRFLKYAFVFVLLLSASIIFYKFQFYRDKIALNEQGATQHLKSESVNKPRKLIIDNSTALVDEKTNLSFKDFNLSKNQNKTSQPSNWSEIKVAAISPGKTVAVTKKEMDETVPLKFNETTISSSEHTNDSNPITGFVLENKNSVNFIDNTTVGNALNPDKVKSTNQVARFRPLPSKFYGTFYASPVFSTVKFQKIDGPGYKLGVALGYNLNKRFDIEIGLQREHINFYSDGKYFERKGLRMKSDRTVLNNVDGSSKITNIPVTLKYNLTSKRSAHFYTAVGINLLQITHTEVYNYTTVAKNGRERDRLKKYSSISDPKYFTGIIASAGYEVKVCNWVNMKAEPYYQIPIQNFGVGRLPVASFGINIGIVKHLN